MLRLSEVVRRVLLFTLFRERYAAEGCCGWSSPVLGVDRGILTSNYSCTYIDSNGLLHTTHESKRKDPMPCHMASPSVEYPKASKSIAYSSAMRARVIRSERVTISAIAVSSVSEP